MPNFPNLTKTISLTRQINAGIKKHTHTNIRNKKKITQKYIIIKWSIEKFKSSQRKLKKKKKKRHRGTKIRGRTH